MARWDIHTLTDDQLNKRVHSLGIAPAKHWEPAYNISHARHLFFVVLPYLFPGISLEYHHYPSGHARLIVSGRDYCYSESVAPGESAGVAMTRLACLAAEHLQNTASK